MLTIVVPTRDRPTFILRLLRYYSKLGVKIQIIVCDSSTPDKQLKSSTIESLLKTGLNLRYDVYPADTPFTEKLLKTVKSVETEYIVLGADDDFFIPKTLTDAVDFLDTHPDYSVFHGEAFTFNVLANGNYPAYGMMNVVGQYPQRAIEHSSSSERLLDGLMNYTTTWYSVHRSNLLLKNISRIDDLGIDISFMELILFSLDMIQGKSQKANRLYMARQVVSKSVDNKIRVLPTGFDWIISPGWSDHFDRMRSYLADQIVQQDNIDPKEASLVVRDAFFSYLGRGMLKSTYLAEHTTQLLKKIPSLSQQNHAIPSAKYILGILVRKIPLLQKLVSQKLSLRVLLSPHSPDHADFLPIYQSISNHPDTLQ
jgi:glycosyltransferase domain-containing protein